MSTISNEIYNVVSKITEERERNGSYKGNGHHLAQEITDAVCEIITTEKNPRFKELAERLVAPGYIEGRFSASEFHELYDYINP